MRPIVAVAGPVATTSATAVATSQTPGAAGYLIINGSDASGGVAYLGVPQHVLITTADTTHVFTVTGTTPTGSAISETVGPIAAGTAQTTQDFFTVTQVYINGAATAAVTVGTGGTIIAATPWVRIDDWAPSAISVQCNVSGTVNYTVQSTLDDPTSPTNPVLPQNVTWVSTSDTNAVGATGNVQTNFAFAPAYIRTIINSGTGSVTMTVIQSSSVTY